VVTVGEAVVDVQRQVDLAVPVRQSQMRQRGGLVEQQRRRFGVSVHLDDLKALVHQVVEDDLPATVGQLLEMTVEHRVGGQQRVERLGQRVDVDGAVDVSRQAHEVAGLGEHLFAARELADAR
jgi:hypothetical protein